MTDENTVRLSGVPETMLWTLHNRASEALRPNGILRDEDAARIYRSIDCDYERSFGKPDGSHALRSRVFDEAMRPWMARQPGGMVVELAAGLETQFQRVDDGQVRWLCVDVPDAFAVRQRFLPETDRCRYLGVSSLDESWIDAVDAAEGVFVTAQGLFMYFTEADVRRLVIAMAQRLTGMHLMFDTVPRAFSRKTVKGFNKTPHYRTPAMPWGVNRGELPGLLKSWSPHIEAVEHLPYGYIRAAKGTLLPVLAHIPLLREFLPSIVLVTTA
jgi:O-methyltransferase involved in polyketide biosynthesis